MFENRVLRGIFGTERDGVTAEWRKIHNEELNDLYCSPNIVRVIKPRRIRWVGHVECKGDKRRVFRVLVKKSSRKWDVEVRTGSSWLRIGTGGGLL